MLSLSLVAVGLANFPQGLLCNFLVHRQRVRKDFLQQQDNGVPVTVQEGAQGRPKMRDIDLTRIRDARQRLAEMIHDPPAYNSCQDRLARRDPPAHVLAVCRGPVNFVN